MVRQALDWLQPQAGDRVLELFAGLGNFTAPLAAHGARVTAVEGEAALVQRGRANLQRNGVDAEFLRADLFQPDVQAPWLRRYYDLALLDPPRSGAREILPALVATQPRRIVYVSCHPGTLARDAGELVRTHGYTLTRAGVLDMFPHTAHVESMALFERE
jgi:23S rRNA (uracil1939-C5)-methyltransferase